MAETHRGLAEETHPGLVSDQPDRLHNVSDTTVSPDATDRAVSTSPGHVPHSGATAVSLQLRWGDMDVNEHVNNVQFARLFEESRVRTFATWFEETSTVLPILVARQVIEFRAVLMYSFEPVTIETGVSRIGTSSYTLMGVLTDPAGQVCAVAETTVVTIDPRTGRPRPISDEGRAVLEGHRTQPVPMHPAN